MTKEQLNILPSKSYQIRKLYSGFWYIGHHCFINNKSSQPYSLFEVEVGQKSAITFKILNIIKTIKIILFYNSRLSSFFSVYFSREYNTFPVFPVARFWASKSLSLFSFLCISVKRHTIFLLNNAMRRRHLFFSSFLLFFIQQLSFFFHNDKLLTFIFSTFFHVWQWILFNRIRCFQNSIIFYYVRNAVGNYKNFTKQHKISPFSHTN